MSGPRGEHWCDYATDQNDINAKVWCKLFKRETWCAGVVEECEDDDELIKRSKENE